MWVVSDSEETEESLEWEEHRLPHLVTEYEPKDIFGVDETALFYRAIPATTCAFQGEAVRGSMTPKDWLTLLLYAKMNGTEKLWPIVIGMVKQPTAFKSKYTVFTNVSLH